jgi:hypothetical protein
MRSHAVSTLDIRLRLGIVLGYAARESDGSL